MHYIILSVGILMIFTYKAIYIYQKCVENVLTTVNIFHNVGLIPHPQKSVLIPGQEIVFLSFVINSLSMTINLTVEKKEKIKILITPVKNSGQHVSTRLVARLTGCLVASLPAVIHGAMCYKYLEKEKNVALHSFTTLPCAPDQYHPLHK